MEACEIDQFEMHVRAVMNLPCPPPKMKVGAALMLNILGEFFTSVSISVSEFLKLVLEQLRPSNIMPSYFYHLLSHGSFCFLL